MSDKLQFVVYIRTPRSNNPPTNWSCRRSSLDIPPRISVHEP